tara:strand:- start:239 stop:484 length:246 start_codon:yes stop_codon:yes gene_type:complete
MDKYTKGILTVIAVGIIGLNVQMMNDGGFITKAHSTEPHNHLSYDIIDLDEAIQNQRSLFLMFVEDCKIEEEFTNNFKINC